jgi:hypothetical protein
MYTAISIDVFIAAFSGALSGMRTGRSISQNTNPAHYVQMNRVALAFAEAFDTEYASVLPNELQLADIQEICAEQMSGKQPGGVPPTTTAFWVKPVQAIIALLSEADATVAANVTNPIPVPAPVSFSVLNLSTVIGVSASLQSTIPTTLVATIVDGYYAAGDNGGGFFYWDPASILADDGGAVINPTGHVGAGRWIRLINESRISVKWWGAKGTNNVANVAADTAGFQGCAAWLAAHEYLIVDGVHTFGEGGLYAAYVMFVPQGIYDYDNSVAPLTVLRSIEGDNLSTIRAFDNTKKLILTGGIADHFNDLCLSGGLCAFFLGATSGQSVITFNRCVFRFQSGPSVYNVGGFQGSLQFQNCYVQTPCMWWGSAEEVVFNDCSLLPYFTYDVLTNAPYPSYDSGTPLAFVTNAAAVKFQGCRITASPIDKDSNLINTALYQGTGNVSFVQTTYGGESAMPLVRENKSGCDYLGIPFLTDPGSALQVMIEDSVIAGCNAQNWLEVYDEFPTMISVGVTQGSPVTNDHNSYQAFVGSYGIWVKDTVTIPSTGTSTAYKFRFDGSVSLDAFKIRSSSLANRLVPENGTNLYDQLRGLITSESEWYAGQMYPTFAEVQRDNLYVADKYELANDFSGATAINVTPVAAGDTTLGYRVTTWTSTANDSTLTGTFPAAGGLNPGAAGLYTWSGLFKSTKSITIELGLDGQVLRKFTLGPNRWQLCSFTFYHDGVTARRFLFSTANTPNGTVYSGALFAVHPGTKPAPYQYPHGSTAALTVPAIPADPADGNDTVQDWHRNRTVQRSAAPAGGVHLRGEWIWNLSPAALGYVGFVCTASGSPGTWVGVGQIGPDYTGTSFSATGNLLANSGGAQALLRGYPGAEAAFAGLWLQDVNPNNFALLSDGTTVHVRAITTLSLETGATGNQCLAATATETYLARNNVKVLDFVAQGAVWTTPEILNPVILGDFAAGGDIGTAAATVDIRSAFEVAQTTAAQVLTLPAPTSGDHGRIAYVANTGSQAFTMYGKAITPATYSIFYWNGAAWCASV